MGATTPPEVLVLVISLAASDRLRRLAYGFTFEACVRLHRTTPSWAPL
jgi:hypothetical protein